MTDNIITVSMLLGTGIYQGQKPLLPGVSKQTVCHWIASGKLPAPVRVGRSIFWHAEDILPVIERLEQAVTRG